MRPLLLFYFQMVNRAHSSVTVSHATQEAAKQTNALTMTPEEENQGREQEKSEHTDVRVNGLEWSCEGIGLDRCHGSIREMNETLTVTAHMPDDIFVQKKTSFKKYARRYPGTWVPHSTSPLTKIRLASSYVLRCRSGPPVRLQLHPAVTMRHNQLPLVGMEKP